MHMPTQLHPFSSQNTAVSWHQMVLQYILGYNDARGTTWWDCLGPSGVCVGT